MGVMTGSAEAAPDRHMHDAFAEGCNLVLVAGIAKNRNILP
jgi:hypothetical protein